MTKQRVDERTERYPSPTLPLACHGCCAFSETVHQDDLHGDQPRRFSDWGPCEAWSYLLTIDTLVFVPPFVLHSKGSVMLTGPSGREVAHGSIVGVSDHRGLFSYDPYHTRPIP